MNNQFLRLIGLLIMAFLSGCTPTRVLDKVSLTSPEQWHHVPSVQTASVDLKQWWMGFQNPLLSELITRALAANHDIRIAKARIREAGAIVTIAESALYPSIDLFTSGGREKRIDRIVGVPGKNGIELITPAANIISGGLAARWEIDLFGSKHLEAEAATAQLAGTEEAQRAVQVGLLAQVATNYLELRGVQKRSNLQRETIEIQREKLRALQLFNQMGLVNTADVASQEALLRTTEAALTAITSAEKNLIHRLGVLLGDSPESLENRLVSDMGRLIVLPGIPKLLPSDLLAQRPDLRLAQTEVSTAAANLGAARADLLPKLVLSANGGFGALAVSGFPSLAESVYALGSGLTAPIFSAGRIRAHIATADARLDQVAANYEKTFLLALEDVENAYVEHTASMERLKQLSEAEMAAEKAYCLKEALYQRGASDYLSVLDAQRNKLAVGAELTKAETDVHVSLVSLYRAFGGGWTTNSLISRGIDDINNGKNSQQAVATVQ